MILQVIVYVLVDGVWEIINLNWNSFKSKLIHNDNLSNFDSTKIDSSNNNILLSSVLKICLLLFQEHDVISSTFIKESVSTLILILRFHIQINFYEIECRWFNNDEYWYPFRNFINQDQPPRKHPYDQHKWRRLLQFSTTLDHR